MAPKLPKLEEELGEDRISQMPNDVLVRILSLLDDSVLAVQTTILSKRWNNLWTSISSIRLGDFDHECDDHFMTFVDSVVSLHNSTDILKFGLIYNNEGSRNDMLADDYARIHRCICTVVEHNVVKLRLKLYNPLNLDQEFPLLFPESLFMCKTLVVLKVSSNCISFSNCPMEGCFPSLKVLYLEIDDSDHDSRNSLENLFTYCPVLEDLTITGVLALSNINISAPELKTLTMKHIHSYSVVFSINAPKLENFDLLDHFQFPNKYILENGKSLVKVKLEFLDYEDYGTDDGIADHATALFAQISNVEDLSLSLQGLNASYLPEFVNLSRLVLVLHGFNYWEFLIECLKRCPNLKHLDLKHEDNKWHRRKYELQWEFFNPQERPACLVSHLKTISIKGFKGQRDEMEVAEYLLKNGEVLNRMSIHTESEDLLCTKKKLYKKLLTYVRGSRSCVILAD
ncbi:PREDICTED: FBD-associated F-box protein At4g10400-like [Fragaria vesca subsp. vesca]|uniref:FBD-associated F-box protein At4g10400-like n=1 Tax=Fragaria vesca subsp. vesca TaxID=101020 RepID=UPI0002C31065|nr:PREDICTED: FBD-associated F-box protein At4g10400-like [Fragaria vesca subsp. vesca]